MEPVRLFGPDMLADPYPAYRRLRDADPVHWDPALDAWLLTRYDDVVAAFHEPRLSAERAEPLRRLAACAEFDPFFDYLAGRMDFKDPPAHGRLRGLATQVFTPHAIAALRPHIAALVEQFLDRAEQSGRLDVIADLAFPLPGTVIAELLGVPVADRQRLKAWSDAFVGFFKTVPSATTTEEYRRSYQAAEELGAYFRGVLQQGSAGLLGALARAELDGQRLSDLELSANATLLLHAGHETTTHLIGNGLLALLHHPEQLQKLRDEPALLPTAVEEFLRYDSPVQFTYRQAATDFELQGRPIRRGQVVHLLLAAANRDPAHFPGADALDVARSPNKHVAFGYGHHFCLGAALARLEAQVAFAVLLRRYPRLRLAGTPVRQENFVLRGLKSLPVELRG